MIIKQLITFFTLILLSSQIDCQLSYDSFVQNFANCKWDSENFDKCVKDGLNSVRPFFKAGIPELNIGSFDPFFAKEVTQTRGGNNLNYKLKLRNVYERGWTQSSVTKFKCNWRKRFIQYTQHFPEKFLEGEYEFDGTVMTGNMKNKGTWNMTLLSLHEDHQQSTRRQKGTNQQENGLGQDLKRKISETHQICKIIWARDPCKESLNYNQNGVLDQPHRTVQIGAVNGYLLYDYVQTTTLTRPNNSKDIKVRIEVQQIGNMDLHISNLLRGRTVMENMLDRMINASWRPGFAVIRPLINDIVSTAFTEIFNKNFKDLDVNNIIPRN
uniref:Uncharacterized protein n=1 Tax=Rhodnius prolixus TaxID=13249 RepID=T1HEQ9_RHOPR